MNTKSKKGFTLVEILIVVVIIGLLAVMAIPAFQKVHEAQQREAITKNLRALASGAHKYFQDNNLTTVDTADLIGNEEYVQSFEQVVDETYTSPITTDLTELKAVGSEVSVSISFNGLLSD